jgi:hypothetical protein
MKKALLLFLVIALACKPSRNENLERSKEIYLETMRNDSAFLKQGIESGLMEKIKNVQSEDSLHYYLQKFHQYNDSVITLQRKLQRNHRSF